MHSDVFRWPVIEAQVEHRNFSGEPSWKYLSSLKLTVRTWKWMAGICVSFWNGLFSEAMLGSGRVMDSIRASHPIWKNTWISNQLYHPDFLELSHQSLRHVPWVNLRIEIIWNHILVGKTRAPTWISQVQVPIEAEFSREFSSNLTLRGGKSSPINIEGTFGWGFKCTFSGIYLPLNVKSRLFSRRRILIRVCLRFWYPKKKRIPS